ncbi:MAG TPA: ABC transporter ATP-binding protein [Nitrososphaerales archaeon]|nr:ABC transporter ATP-binding protein [Nitrososphaerales archaeon]
MSIQGLSKHFGDSSGINGISFEVPDGKLLSILGPSGSGKTTLLRCVSGVEEPEEGTIKIGAKVVFDSSKKLNLPPEARGIGMVFQSNALWPHMTVQKNVAYPLEVRGESNTAQRVDEVLALLKMELLAGRYPSELSGGEQQRVAIARAIVYRPSLVLLDEPFSSLDVLLRESLRDDIRQLQLKLGTTMIYVTHDRVDALSLGDIIGLVSEGRLVAYNSPETLLRSPPNSFAAKFLGGMLILDAEASPISSDILSVTSTLATFEVPVGGPSGTVKLCVPPSACRLVPDGTGTIPGTVTGISRFPSGYIASRVTTSSGTVEVRLEPEGPTFSLGDRVRIAVDARKCLVLPS